MYVCICNAVTDSQILAAVSDGHASLKALREHLGVAAECGRCARCAADLLKTCKGCGQCKKHHAHGHSHDGDMTPAGAHRPETVQAVQFAHA